MRLSVLFTCSSKLKLQMFKLCSHKQSYCHCVILKHPQIFFFYIFCFVVTHNCTLEYVFSCSELVASWISDTILLAVISLPQPTRDCTQSSWRRRMVGIEKIHQYFCHILTLDLIIVNEITRVSSCHVKTVRH